MTPTNSGAVLTTQNGPVTVQPTEYVTPAETEILVRAGAVAINPYDWILQDALGLVASWIKLPFPLGTDVAGDVIAVGSKVTRFAPGDRVLGYAVGLQKHVKRACEAAFQEYVILRQDMASPIPPTMSYESAAVLPLGLTTAACALFQKDQLALPYPTFPVTTRNEVVIVWGASTSVGCNAVQLAVAAGYAVVATASPKNHDYIKQLGAELVFDYRSPSVVSDIVAAVKGRIVAGAVAIGEGAVAASMKVLSQCEGRKVVAQVSFDAAAQGFPKGLLDFPMFIMRVVGQMASQTINSKLKGVKAKFFDAGDALENGVGKEMFVNFLPRALAEGAFLAAPQPKVIGKGLESVQEAMNVSKKGISAAKVVVTLQ